MRNLGIVVLGAGLGGCASVISNGCAWQKQHIRQPLRD
jgi:uncharacterized protein YceK